MGWEKGIEPSSAGSQPATLTVELLSPLETKMGIEPTISSFADYCLTVWLLRHWSIMRESDSRIYVGNVALYH